MTLPPPIQLDNLVKVYGSKKSSNNGSANGVVRAVNNVSLEVKPGEIFGLLGPNGAGKTSIISTLVTLEEPTSGTVKIFGLDVTKHPKETKMMTGFVPQELIHHGYFSVEEILQFHSGYFGRRKNKERIDYLLNRLSLFEHRHKKVKQLSGGMKRRLLIAKALVHEPKLLLLDEPTAGVDIELRTSLWKFVAELKSQGITILLTTHYIQEAEELCDRVGIIQNGEIKTIGKTKDLVKDLTKREIRLKFNDDKESRYTVPASKGVGELLAELNVDLKTIKDINIREGSLEDALRRVLEGPSS